MKSMFLRPSPCWRQHDRPARHAGACRPIDAAGPTIRPRSRCNCAAFAASLGQLRVKRRRLRSANADACPRPLDDVDRGRERALDIQGVVSSSAHPRPLERRDGPAGVARVAAQDVGEDLGFVDRAPAPRNSRGAALRRAPAGVAVTKIFTSASGQITVPMSRPSSTAPGGGGGEGALESRQGRPHLAEWRRPARPPRRPPWLLSAASSKVGRIERIAPPRWRGAAIVGPVARIEHRLGDRAVEQPGIEMRAARNGRRAACRACPCRMPPARRSR